MTTEVLAPPTHGPSIDLFGRTYRVALPRRGDPRLAVAAVIISVQILGQTVLGFNLSIAQILISIGVAGFKARKNRGASPHMKKAPKA